MEATRPLPRHRHGLTREQVRTSQSGRILAATADVVAQAGYAGTSVAAIVERAGVSRRTFYELFEDKEAAFLAAYAAVDTVIARMVEAAGTHTEPRAILRAGIRAYLEALAEEPAFTHMLVIDAVGATPAILRRRAQAFRDFVRALAIPAPGLEPQTLLALLGGINELVLQHLILDRAETLPELVPAVERFVERVSLAPPEPS